MASGPCPAKTPTPPHPCSLQFSIGLGSTPPQARGPVRVLDCTCTAIWVIQASIYTVAPESLEKAEFPISVRGRVPLGMPHKGPAPPASGRGGQAKVGSRRHNPHYIFPTLSSF